MANNILKPYMIGIVRGPIYHERNLWV